MATTTSPSLGAKLGGGKAADVHAWGADKVIKLYQPDIPARLVAAEERNVQVLNAAGLPVPRFFERLEFNGRRGVVFERIDGPSLSASLARNPLRLFRSARQFAAIQRHIHRTDAPQLPPVTEHLRRVIAHVSVLTHAQKMQINALLTSLPAGASVCHFDFHPSNVILSSRGPIVLDWGSARHGNPLADVARTCVLFATDHLARPAAPAIKIWNEVFVRAYRHHYFGGQSQIRGELQRWIAVATAASLRNAGSREIPILMPMVERGLRNQSP